MVSRCKSMESQNASWRKQTQIPIKPPSGRPTEGRECVTECLLNKLHPPWCKPLQSTQTDQLAGRQEIPERLRAMHPPMFTQHEVLHSWYQEGREHEIFGGDGRTGVLGTRTYLKFVYRLLIFQMFGNALRLTRSCF